MNSKNILKIIGIILLVVIAIFLIHTFRNYIIITNLQNKIANYSYRYNYHVKETTILNNKTNSEMNYYKLGNNQVTFIDRKDDNFKMSIYDDGEKVNTFIENPNLKTVLLNCEKLESFKIYNNLENENKLQTLLGSMTSKIKSVKYNGKKYYSVKGFKSPYSLINEDTETYIDKNTGLCTILLDKNTGIITEREYEFDTVNNYIFQEPDINDYKIQNNN